MSENVNAVENATVATPDQGELQGVEAQEVAKAKRRARLDRKAADKAKGKPAPAKGKGKGKGEPAPESNGKVSKGKSKGLALKVSNGRITNIKAIFEATNNGKSYAVSRFLVRLINAVFSHLRDGKGGKWDCKVGEGLGDGLEYHWLLKSKEEGTQALQHATDAAKALGFKFGAGDGSGDGFIVVEPDGKANSKQQRLVFAY